VKDVAGGGDRGRIAAMVSAHDTTRALDGHDFASPIDDRWFEDYRPGETFEYGWTSLTSEEIVE
jgi:hypothetical protein